MVARLFLPSDLAAMNAWLAANGEPAKSPEHVAPVGFAVDGIAAGFLCRIEGMPVAYIGGFATNPSVGSARRHRAIGVIVDALLSAAKSAGVKRIMVTTADSGLIARCKDAGATFTGFVAAFTKEL